MSASKELPKSTCAKWFSRAAAIVQFTANIATTTGIVWLAFQVSDIRVQERYRQHLAKQTHRPWGYIQHSLSPDPQKVQPGVSGDTSYIPYILTNRGAGPMLHVGIIYHVGSGEMLDYRQQLLDGITDGWKVLNAGGGSVGRPLLPNDEPVLSQTIEVADIPRYDDNTTYCLHVIWLYTDLDNNLYDTQRMDILPPLNGKTNGTTYSTQEYYNTYADAEYSKMVDVLMKIDSVRGKYLVEARRKLLENKE